jgi:hypothetical protein
MKIRNNNMKARIIKMKFLIKIISTIPMKLLLFKIYVNKTQIQILLIIIIHHFNFKKKILKKITLVQILIKKKKKILYNIQ